MSADIIKRENGNLFVGIRGRITSANAEELFDSLDKIIEDNPGDKIVYDLQDLEAISSAGLRVFLKIKKKYKDIKLINAGTDVYDVFEITGFVEILDITKAYRSMSIEGCEQIGEGAKGVVYEIDDETVIKVYKDPDCMDDIVNERECAKKALVMGVPTAIPFDIVRVGDRFGSVFELVNAKSVTNTIMDDPSKTESVISEYAGIMREMHNIIDNNGFGIKLPEMKREVETWAEFAKEYVSDEIYAGIQQFVADMKETDNLLHGDGHPNNVMCTADGQLFIDMDTLCIGDPRADIAVVYTAMVGYKTVNPNNDFIPIDVEIIKNWWNIFFNEYYKNESEEEKVNIEKWCKCFTYLRLFRRGIRKMSDKPYFAANAKRELEAAIMDYVRN